MGEEKDEEEGGEGEVEDVFEMSDFSEEEEAEELFFTPPAVRRR